jgi:hypothetical protein
MSYLIRVDSVAAKRSAGAADVLRARGQSVQAGVAL